MGLQSLDEFMPRVDRVGRILIQHADTKRIDDEHFQLPTICRRQDYFVDILIIETVADDHNSSGTARYALTNERASTRGKRYFWQRSVNTLMWARIDGCYRARPFMCSGRHI